MTTRVLWAVAVVGACTSQAAEPPPTIAGRYDITASGSGCSQSPLDLELELDGTLISYNSMPKALAPDGSDAYAGTSCTAYECQAMSGGVVTFSSARIERTSPTTIHGTQAGKGQRMACTEGVCPAGFGSNAIPCEFDATLSEPAPVVTSVSPSSVSSSSCSKPLTIRGGYFQSGATVSYRSAAPSCTAPTMDRSEDVTCALVVDHATATAITAHFANCPTQADAFQSTLTLVITTADGLESLASLHLDP